MNKVIVTTVALLVVAAAQAPAQTVRRPPRDVGGLGADRASTAAIGGRITAADSGMPLRRVEITATAANNETFRRATITDDDGRYELTGLAAGEWRLTTMKSGFISQQFGQRRPFGPAPPIAVSEGQRFTADFALTRASAINGRVFDEFGEPLAAVRIDVMRARMVEKQRRLEPVGEGDLTDDIGSFRIYGLPPGEYFVSGSLRVAPVDSVIRTTYSPTYYPGTGSYAEAQRVLLAQGAEANIAFPLLPFRTARVSGVVLTSSGGPAEAFLNLAADTGELGVPLGVGGVTRADGGFTLPDVPPGAYTLTVTLRNDNSPTAESAAVPVAVYGDDVEGVTVVTARPARLRGTVVADAGVTRRLPEAIDVSARSTRVGGDTSYGQTEKNAFNLLAPPGPFRVEVEVPDGWMVKGILAADVDALDMALDVKGQPEVPVRVVLTDRVTEVSGVVAPSLSARAPTVVAFPEDSAKWTQPSRFIRAAGVERGGTYRIVGLPPGQTYRVAAIDDLEEGEGDDPDLLMRIRDRASSVNVTEGAKHVVDLNVIPR